MNALYDDPERDRLLHAIRGRCFFRPSEVNVMEVIQNADAARRVGLLRLLHELADGALPLALPTLIVRRIAAATAQGEGSGDGAGNAPTLDARRAIWSFSGSGRSRFDAGCLFGVLRHVCYS